MPYKDPVLRKQYKYQWYLDNKESVHLRGRRDKHKKRMFVAKIKDVPCMDCGQKYPFYVMDLDHRDPTNKIQNVGKLINQSWEKILLEIDKCDVVCSNCHRIRTYNRAHAFVA